MDDTVTKERGWIYLNEDQWEYVDSVKKLIRADSRSEAIRFLVEDHMKILPRAPDVARFVSTMMDFEAEEMEKEEKE